MKRVINNTNFLMFMSMVVLLTLLGCSNVPANKSPLSMKSPDVLKTKLSIEPTLQWLYTTKEFGFGRDAIQTSDGGYILVGETAMNPDALVVKIDADGHESWRRTFAGEGSESCSSICQTKDGGYIIAGEIGAPNIVITPVPASNTGNSTKPEGTKDGFSDIWIIKTDSDGQETWNTRLGGNNEEGSRAVIQASDGGYVVVGITYSYGAGGGDVFLVKTDAKGREVWSRVFGGNNADYGNDIKQTTDGGYIITGVTSSYGAGNRDIYLIKTDANGVETWSNTFGGSGWEWGWSVSQTRDGGFIITGYTTSYGAGEEDVWLVKTDSYGKEIWNKTFGGTERDEGKSVCQTTDGGYVLTGYTSSYADYLDDIWLIKTDALGNMTWDKTFNADGNEYGSSVIQTGDYGYIVAGQSKTRMVLLKYKSE